MDIEVILVQLKMNVHVTDEKIFSISNFLVPEKGANTHEELRHTFVPYTEPGELPLPNMAKLIGQRHRYYLHPVVDEAAYHEEKFEAHRADLERAGEKTKDIVYEPSLDLGTASLQRIVSQMKGLKFETKEHRFNKESAKLGGLKRYTDFISNPHKTKTHKFPHSVHKPKPDDYKVGFKPAGYGKQVDEDILSSVGKITEQPAAVAVSS